MAGLRYQLSLMLPRRRPHSPEAFTKTFVGTIKRNTAEARLFSMMPFTASIFNAFTATSASHETHVPERTLPGWPRCLHGPANIYTGMHTYITYSHTTIYPYISCICTYTHARIRTNTNVQVRVHVTYTSAYTYA